MPVPVEILSRLLWIRDAAALPDVALVDQLGLEPKALAALVQAHPERFPEALVFHLTAEERQKIPDAPVLAFTESGAALLAGLVPAGQEPALLRLMPAFAEGRHVLTAQAELSRRVTALEQKLEALTRLLQTEEEGGGQEHPIGFVTEADLPHGLKARDRAGKGRA
jgi:hypothetical protein